MVRIADALDRGDVVHRYRDRVPQHRTRSWQSCAGADVRRAHLVGVENLSRHRRYDVADVINWGTDANGITALGTNQITVGTALNAIGVTYDVWAITTGTVNPW
jgi:hypothetical protein